MDLNGEGRGKLADVGDAIAPVAASSRASTRPGSRTQTDWYSSPFASAGVSTMSRSHSGTPGRLLVGDRDHHQSLDLVEPLEQPETVVGTSATT